MVSNLLNGVLSFPRVQYHFNANDVQAGTACIFNQRSHKTFEQLKQNFLWLRLYYMVRLMMPSISVAHSFISLLTSTLVWSALSACRHFSALNLQVHKSQDPFDPLQYRPMYHSVFFFPYYTASPSFYFQCAYFYIFHVEFQSPLLRRSKRLIQISLHRFILLLLNIADFAVWPIA